jgi:UDPglucose 6-dehydrogenase
MQVCVFGLWHLGCVTAACLADAGHSVIAIDADPALIERLRLGQLPLHEPGLAELVARGLSSGRLRFATVSAEALAAAEIVWVTFDTPVSEDDIPDVASVTEPIIQVGDHLPDDCLVLVSSQVPVGTTRRLANEVSLKNNARFGYIPENLRLGKAIEVFLKPDRVVVGLQSNSDRTRVTELFAPFTDKLIWMSPESAEMTKHAINAFLATSVVFMNELSIICEQVGADAKEVEVGLKSEARIGPMAYLSPGGPFAGGTLARDVNTLIDLAGATGISTRVLTAVRESNNDHRSWILRTLRAQLVPLASKRIAILGLTYKPQTSTLRRSSSIELALALRQENAVVSGFDPAIRVLPTDLAGALTLANSADEAMAEADAIVLATPWQEFRDLDWSGILSSIPNVVVVDPGWFIPSSLLALSRVRYFAVGRAVGEQ